MSVEEVCERIKQSLQDHFADLENATKHCIEKLSSELYSKGLVTAAVRDAPTCSKILDELQAGLEQIKYFTPLRIRYQKFLECLSAQGGPSKGVSDQLMEEWEEIKQDYEEQVTKGGERIKTDLVTNKQLIALLKKQDDKIETIEARLKEKEEVTERLNTELKETQEEKRLLQEKKSQELEKLETDRIKIMEEEIQVLVAQCNAYSRECEKQKGLVAQNQERRKTEIQELNEKLTSEQKSKQQLESQLTIMKQQYDSVSASKESLHKKELEQVLYEKIKLLETENTLIKEDFESERNDRERIHAQLTDLQGKYGLLQQELVEKEQKLVEAQMKHHNLQQSHSTVEHDLEVSKERVVELLKKEFELLETIKSLTEEKRKMDKQLKEMKAMETERIRNQEEEIQVLVAQCNAYSRECEKQKGLVAQNQERHKTEIQELNEKLTNEQKSKQQLESQLTTMKQLFDSVSASKESLQQSNQKLANDFTILRQQFDTLTASRENLLTAYNQEQAMVTSLEQQLQRMREESAAMKAANEVLKDKIFILQQQLSSQRAMSVISSYPNIPPKISARPNTISPAPPTGNNPTPVPQGDGNVEMVFISQQVAPPPHSEQPDSLPDDTPLMSKEEIARLFKWSDQQDDSGRATVTQTPQQVEDSLVKEQRRQELAQKAEEALREVEQIRKQPPHKTMLPHASSKQEPVNQRQPKKKVNKQQAAADDSDSDIEENPLLKGIDIDDEIREMAEEVRRMSRRPDTQQVLFDDEDSSLPYDPNLVCPKCGRQYRVGGIQKLKRHMIEFCTGKR